MKVKVVIILAIFLTFLSFIESFLLNGLFVIYVLILILVPLYFKTYKVRKVSKREIKLFAKLLLITFILFALINVAYSILLKYFSVEGNYFYDVNASFFELGKKIKAKFSISTSAIILIYTIYLVLIMPVSEELFYRGFLFDVLNCKFKFIRASVISSFFFGVRHLVHFLPLFPYPLFSELYYFFITFLYGLILSYVYEKTKNIIFPIFTHSLINVFVVFFTLQSLTM